MNESKPRWKREKPIGPKDRNPRKRKGAKNIDGKVEVDQRNLIAPEEPTPEELFSPEENVVVLEETKVPNRFENNEISINCEFRWERNKVNVDDIFAYKIAFDVINDDEDHEPTSIVEYQ